MLDEYKDGQPIAVSILENAIEENKLSHAYLIDINNYSKAYEFVLSFIKSVVCFNVDNEKEVENICRRIDDGNYTEIKIIEPDGSWIKKDQMVDLQSEFSLKGVEGEKRFYIIKECDKMNMQSSNSILKFLEEPEMNIIAILMTNNINQLLDTIVSRCQIIRLNDNNTNNFLFKDKVSNNESVSIINDIIEFILFYEKNGISTIANINKLLSNILLSKENIDFILDVWIHIYYDVLSVLCDEDSLFFVDYTEKINDIVLLNNKDRILNKLYILIDSKNDLKFNVNLNLFLDKLLIDLVGE